MLTCDKGLSFRAWLHGSWAWSPSSIGSRTTTLGGAAALFGNNQPLRDGGCLRFAPAKPMRICSAFVQRKVPGNKCHMYLPRQTASLNIESNKGCVYIRRIYAADLCSMVPDPCRRTARGGLGPPNSQVNHQLVLRVLTQFPAFRTSISSEGPVWRPAWCGGDARPLSTMARNGGPSLPEPTTTVGTSTGG